MSIGLTLIGGRGYTGEALLRLIEAHPEFEIARVGSRSLAGQRVCDVFEGLACDATFEVIAPGDVGADECAILALPNGEAERYVARMPDGTKALDLSADYRFDDSWYYGLPELNPRTPESSSRISNPGCYATAMQLALAPFADRLSGWPSAIGISGYSGAGRKPSPKNDPERLENNLLPYALAGHMHEREVSHRLGKQIRFSPHVGAFFRGISITAHLTLDAPVRREAVADRYREVLGGNALVEVVDDIPEIAAVANTPLARVGGFTVDDRDPHRVVVVAVLDNLLKGAASQAIQNLNALFGLDDALGLTS
ncbi:MAG: N-acetyl-gamma-glutamyl-phosphate reductase [Pseudomonadota bacterium]